MGTVKYRELPLTARMSGFDSTPEELRTMIEMVDSNKNGTVDFPEFLKMMTTMMEAAQTPGDQDEDISQAFKVFDKVKKVSYVID